MSETNLTKETAILTIEQIKERIGKIIYLEANLKRQYKCMAKVFGEAAGRIRFVLVNNDNELFLRKTEYGTKWKCWDKEGELT